MKKKMLIIICFICIISISYLLYEGFSYFSIQNENKKKIEYCSQNNSSDCYTKMFELLVPKLLIYNAQKNGKEISLAKVDKTPTWYPFFVYEQSDAFFNLYSKQLYNPIKITSYRDKICEFFKLRFFEFIQTEKQDFEESQTDLFKKLAELKLNNQKLVVKLDILNLSNELIDKILEYSDIVNGFLIVLHMETPKDIIQAQKILEKLSEKYILTSRNSDYGDGDVLFLNTANRYKAPQKIASKYYEGYIYDSTLILSFVNKELLDNYEISTQQNTDKFYTGEKVCGHRPMYKIPKGNIHWVVTFTEIAKQKYKQWIKQS